MPELNGDLDAGDPVYELLISERTYFAGIPMHRTTSESVWLPSEPKPEFPLLLSNRRVDVAVVGAGITGLTTAILLQREGLKVALVEANHVGCGVSGHSTAKLTALHRLGYVDLEKDLGSDASAAYAAANQAGIERVATLVSELEIDCGFSRRSAYTYTTTPELLHRLQRETEAAARAGLQAAFTKQTDLPFAVEGAVRVDNQAQFDPYRYCRHLAKSFVAAGGELFENSRVASFEQDDHCILRTACAQLKADYVVLATLLPFLDRGGLFARTYPSRSY